MAPLGQQGREQATGPSPIRQDHRANGPRGHAQPGAPRPNPSRRLAALPWPLTPLVVLTEDERPTLKAVTAQRAHLDRLPRGLCGSVARVDLLIPAFEALAGLSSADDLGMGTGSCSLGRSGGLGAVVGYGSWLGRGPLL